MLYLCSMPGYKWFDVKILIVSSNIKTKTTSKQESCLIFQAENKHDARVKALKYIGEHHTSQETKALISSIKESGYA